MERVNDITDYESYVKRMINYFKEAVHIAQVHSNTKQQRQVELCNRSVKGADIKEGDQVFLANRGERGHRKLADRWESTLYTVVSQDSRCHTYHIRNPDNGHEKVVHINLLLQASFLPVHVDRDT